MSLFSALVIIVVFFIVSVFLGFSLGRWYCHRLAVTQGGFSFGKYDYVCIASPRDNPANGLPEALWGPGDQDNGAFAKDTLGKIKFLKPGQIRDLTTKDQPRRALFGTGADYDCAQCCKDANDIQSRMILCPECGNKRCPKAQNHRYSCTASNVPEQIGMFDIALAQKRLNGSDIADSNDSAID